MPPCSALAVMDLNLVVCRVLCSVTCATCWACAVCRGREALQTRTRTSRTATRRSYDRRTFTTLQHQGPMTADCGVQTAGAWRAEALKAPTPNRQRNYAHAVVGVDRGSGRQRQPGPALMRASSCGNEARRPWMCSSHHGSTDGTPQAKARWSQMNAASYPAASAARASWTTRAGSAYSPRMQMSTP